MPSFSTEERQLLNDSLADYFTNQYPFERFRSLSDPSHEDGFGRENWAQYSELGWLGVAAPEDAGGSSGGMTELGIVMAAAGGALAMEPLLETVVLGASALELGGSAEQMGMLGSVVAGDCTLAFCHGEPDAGYARHYVTTIARKDADSYVLSGEKSFALHAHAADQLLVTARIGDSSGPLGMFLVPRSSDGLTLRPAPTLDARRGAAVSLANVKVSEQDRLGDDESDRGALLDQVIDRGVVAVCAEACGAMSTVSAQTLEYLKGREQFGQPLAKFQVLQHRMVDMNVATEEARASTHRALRAVDDNEPDAQIKVWRAKVQMARSARFVGAQAIQLHGGMGMTDELAIGHYYKRLTMCETRFGDADWYLKQLALRTSQAA